MVLRQEQERRRVHRAGKGAGGCFGSGNIGYLLPGVLKAKTRLHHQHKHLGEGVPGLRIKMRRNLGGGSGGLRIRWRRTRRPHLPPFSIVFVKLLGYFLDDEAEFADDAADDERFAVGHEVHALGHVDVVDEAFVGYFQPEAPGEIIAV